MSQLKIKLQQAQSAKTLSENMNKVLQVCRFPRFQFQGFNKCFRFKSLYDSRCTLHFGLKEDLDDLKEQINLYESAVKYGVIALDVSSDSENHLSESCVDLGLKKTSKNGTVHRYETISSHRCYCPSSL